MDTDLENGNNINTAQAVAEPKTQEVAKDEPVKKVESKAETPKTVPVITEPVKKVESKAETPKTVPVKTEPVKKVAPKVATPKTVTVKAAAPKVATPNVATPKAAIAKPATPKVATPKVATPKTAPAKTVAKKPTGEGGTVAKARPSRRKSPLKNKTAIDVEDDYGLKLFFQPIYVASENRVFGYECLLRIVDKDLGVITPDAFLNVAKKNASLMKGLEDWSMSELFRISKLFRDNRKYIDMISLNIDTNNFMRKDFYERISKYFDKINENIYIELKEDAFFSEDVSVIETLRKLRDAGIKIAVDDFTANFLTFDWDEVLPFDMIKIDRAFVDRFMISPKAKMIIQKIIDFAKAHKVDIVAVGIENADQERELLSMGCTMMQGYYYAKPLQIKRLMEEKQ